MRGPASSLGLVVYYTLLSNITKDGETVAVILGMKILIAHRHYRCAMSAFCESAKPFQSHGSSKRVLALLALLTRPRSA